MQAYHFTYRFKTYFDTFLNIFHLSRQSFMYAYVEIISTISSKRNRICFHNLSWERHLISALATHATETNNVKLFEMWRTVNFNRADQISWSFFSYITRWGLLNCSLLKWLQYPLSISKWMSCSYTYI